MCFAELGLKLLQLTLKEPLLYPSSWLSCCSFGTDQKLFLFLMGAESLVFKIQIIWGTSEKWEPSWKVVQEIWDFLSWGLQGNLLEFSWSKERPEWGAFTWDKGNSEQGSLIPIVLVGKDCVSPCVFAAVELSGIQIDLESKDLMITDLLGYFNCICPILFATLFNSLILPQADWE